MPFEFKFRTDTDLADGLSNLVDALEKRLELSEPIKMVIAALAGFVGNISALKSNLTATIDIVTKAHEKKTKV